VYSELHAKDLAWQAAPRSVIELLAVSMMVGLLLVLWASSSSAFSAALPKLGLFAVALVQLFPSVTGIGRIRMEIMSGLADTELVYHALTGPMPILEDGTKPLGSIEDAISFEGVSFAYEGRDVLLKDANTKFKKGEVSAIVGPSGAGKTTIINLVLGFFEPTQGKITLDGVPIGEFTLESRLGCMSLVS
jgi:ABC-type multidrug transport system fused ATPase/permease subunit